MRARARPLLGQARTGRAARPRATASGRGLGELARSGRGQRRSNSPESTQDHNSANCSAVIFVRLPKRAARIWFVSPDYHPRGVVGLPAQPWMRPRRRRVAASASCFRAPASALISLSRRRACGKVFTLAEKRRAAHGHSVAAVEPLRSTARVRARGLGLALALPLAGLERVLLRVLWKPVLVGASGVVEHERVPQLGRSAHGRIPRPDALEVQRPRLRRPRENHALDGRAVEPESTLAVAHHEGLARREAREDRLAIRGRERSVEVLGWDAPARRTRR